MIIGEEALAGKVSLIRNFLQGIMVTDDSRNIWIKHLANNLLIWRGYAFQQLDFFFL